MRPFDNLSNYITALEERINAIEKRIEAGQSSTINDHAPIGVSEASKLLRLSASRVYVLSKEGKLPCHRRGGRLYFFRDEINDLIRSCDDSLKVLRTKKKADDLSKKKGGQAL